MHKHVFSINGSGYKMCTIDCSRVFKPELYTTSSNTLRWRRKQATKSVRATNIEGSSKNIPHLIHRNLFEILETLPCTHNSIVENLQNMHGKLCSFSTNILRDFLIRIYLFYLCIRYDIIMHYLVVLHVDTRLCNLTSFVYVSQDVYQYFKYDLSLGIVDK